MMTGLCNVLCSWFSLMALVVVVFWNDDDARQTDWTPFILLVTGSLVILLVFLVKHYSEAASFCCNKRQVHPAPELLGPETTLPDVVSFPVASSDTKVAW
jgi:hypothetical protein